MSKMNKRWLHHYYTRVRFIRPWYLLLAALIFFAAGTYGLRQNNLKMVELRERVTVADEKNGDVEEALKNLRNYVYSHMNTNLSGAQSINPPVQLKYRYERLVAGQQEIADQKTEQIKEQAEAICARRHPGEGYNSPRVACVQDYVRQNAVQPQDIPEDLYKFDFVSPRWTPDFAGISLALGVAFSALFITWLVLERWVRRYTD
jgi:hypothetical protein